jgi:hypothetical protein
MVLVGRAAEVSKCMLVGDIPAKESADIGSPSRIKQVTTNIMAAASARGKISRHYQPNCSQAASPGGMYYGV